MTNERFWEIVESVDWPREDYKEASIDILMNTAPAEIKGFRDKLDEKTATLREAFREVREDMDEDFYVSGDGLDDCVNHIVGLGRLTYENAVEEPQAIVDRYRAGEYTESFSYAVPYATDYEKLGTQYYHFRSSAKIEEYDEIATNEKFSEAYRSKAMFIAELLEDFPQNRGNVDYLKRHDMIDVEDPTEDDLLDWMHETEEELSEDIKGWPVRNLVSDYRKFYIYNQ